jgi:hypothetical protein
MVFSGLQSLEGVLFTLWAGFREMMKKETKQLTSSVTSTQIPIPLRFFSHQQNEFTQLTQVKIKAQAKIYQYNNKIT